MTHSIDAHVHNNRGRHDLPIEPAQSRYTNKTIWGGAAASTERANASAASSSGFPTNPQKYFIVSPSDTSAPSFGPGGRAGWGGIAQPHRGTTGAGTSPTPPPLATAVSGPSRLTSPLSAHCYYLDTASRTAAASPRTTTGVTHRLTSPLRRATGVVTSMEGSPAMPGVQSGIARRLMAPAYLSTPISKGSKPPTPHKYHDDDDHERLGGSAAVLPAAASPPRAAPPPPPVLFRNDGNSSGRPHAITPTPNTSTMADSEPPHGGVESPISNRQDDSRISAMSSDFFDTSGSHRYGPQEDSGPRRPPPPPPPTARRTSTSPSRRSISAVVVSPVTPGVELRVAPSVPSNTASPPYRDAVGDIPLEVDELLFAAKVAEAYAYECYRRDPTYFLHPALASAMEQRLNRDRSVLATNEVVHLGALCALYQWHLSCAKLVQIEQRIRQTIQRAEENIFEGCRCKAQSEGRLPARGGVSAAMVWGDMGRQTASSVVLGNGSYQPSGPVLPLRAADRAASHVSVGKTRDQDVSALFSTDLMGRQPHHRTDDAMTVYDDACSKPVDVVQYLMSFGGRGGTTRSDEDGHLGNNNVFLQRGRRAPVLLSSIVVPATRRPSTSTVDAPDGQQADRRSGSALRATSSPPPSSLVGTTQKPMEQKVQSTTAALKEEMTVFHQVQVVPAAVRVVGSGSAAGGSLNVAAAGHTSPPSTSTVAAQAAHTQRSVLLQQAILSEVLSSSSSSSSAVSSPTVASNHQPAGGGGSQSTQSAEFQRIPTSSSSSLASLCVEDVSTDAT